MTASAAGLSALEVTPWNEPAGGWNDFCWDTKKTFAMRYNQSYTASLVVEKKLMLEISTVCLMTFYSLKKLVPLKK